MDLNLENFLTRNSRENIEETDFLKEARASKGNFTSNRSSINMYEHKQSDEISVQENSNQRGSRGYVTDNNEGVCQEIEDEKETLDYNSEPNLSRESISVLVKLEYKYIGNILDGKRHGFGICEYTNGDIYTGIYQNDLKHGLGKLKTANGKIIVGEYINNSADGFCQYTNSRGSTHLGYMRQSKFLNNEPLIIENSKSRIEGISNLKNGRLRGVGKISYRNGNHYEGEIYNYVEHGWGILTRNDRYIFKGQKRFEGYEGYCEIYYPDRSKYFGWFSKNLREGLGISLSKEGMYSIGKYQGDIKEGGMFTCNKTVCMLELYLQGFLCKVIHKRENIITYIDKVYPEYRYLYKSNNKYLCYTILMDKQDQ